VTSRELPWWAENEAGQEKPDRHSDITSWACISGMAREMGDNPITHLTIVTTPKSRTAVSTNSNSLSRAYRAVDATAAILSVFGDGSICVAASLFGVRKRNNHNRDSKAPDHRAPSGAQHHRPPAYRSAV
jgi:hypothetical protein